MSKEIPILRVTDADLDAVVEFLRSQLLGDSRTRATHACVLMLLPLYETTPSTLAMEGVTASQSAPSLGLTPPELSTLKGVVDGRSNAQIARELNTTVVSVKGVEQSLFRKLGVRPKRRSALVRAVIDTAPSRPVSDPLEPYSRLTPAESSVLGGVGQGCTNREIAHRLKIPEIAVKAAIRGICAKVGATNRRQFERYVSAGHSRS
jgi:DNA-binding NarL/FixJ family response regulator